MLEGVLTALTTPFDESGEVDQHALHRHIDHLRSAGINGLLVCGTTGEGALLSADEKRTVLRAAIAQAGGHIPIVAAVIQPDTRTAIQDVHALEDLGADAVACVSPYYIRVDETELSAHFRALADASRLPVVVYDIPSNTANPLTDLVYDAVFDHPNIVAVKDSSGNFSRFARRVMDQARVAADGVAWIQGEDTLDAPSLLVGANGVVSGLSNVLPEPFVRMVNAARTVDTQQVIAMQRVVNRLHAIVRKTGKGVAAIRVAVSQMGYGSRYLRNREFSISAEWDEMIRDDVEAAMRLMESI